MVNAMKYVNNTGKDSKIKVMDRREKLGFKWITAKIGDVVDLPREVGERERFTPVKGKGLVNTVVDAIKGKDDKAETKDESSNSEYANKLRDIKGMGARTVLDIIEKYPTEDALTTAIDNNEHLPFRNDQCDLLKDAFGSEEENGDEEVEDDKE